MRLKYSLFVLLCAFMLWSFADARASDDEIKVLLRNFTGTDLYALHLAPAGSGKWGEDLLEGGSLPEGGQVTVTFPWRARAIWWDIHVENRNGTAVKWTNVPMRRFRTLTLLFDGNSPKIRGE